MARQDNSPGRYPLTRGLQFSADGQAWEDVDSGVSPWGGSGDYKFVRINPDLFDNKTSQPSQVLVKGSAALRYTSALTDPTTPQGFAEFGSSFFQAVWASIRKETVFGLQPAMAADTLQYMIVMRELTASDRPDFSQ